METSLDHLVTIATTDLTAVTRGRPIPASEFDKAAQCGVGWVPANLSLTPFGNVAAPNPWGSSGDLRLVPDSAARFTTDLTGSATPFDVALGDLVELNGNVWVGCTRSLLKGALSDLTAETGLVLVTTFEQEFQIFETSLPPAHPFSIAALRRADPFPTKLHAALKQAGAAPEMVLAEFGVNQFEITTAPADPLVAADRAIVVREVTRELARTSGWRASFSPKASPDGAGNGVHIHFSFKDKGGKPVTYDPTMPGGLSSKAGAFCAGVLHHLPAITVLTASSVPSYYRLKPHSWSSSYTWLAQQDREATLRICPVVTFANRDPSGQYNIEYRAADATANPYLALTAIVRAGLDGLRTQMAMPSLFSGDPENLSADERSQLGLRRLPESLTQAIEELEASDVVKRWFPPKLLETFVGFKDERGGTLLGSRCGSGMRPLWKPILMLTISRSGWPPPCEVIEESGDSEIVLVCEHASNFIPEEYARLGLDDSDIQRHIAWDIGAAEVTRKLAAKLGAPAFLGTYSRLLVDLNRPRRCADSITLQSEDTVIPGNASLSVEEVVRREEIIFTPFQDEVASYLDTRAANGRLTKLVAIHSFTPVYSGVPRPWHAGVLFGHAERFAKDVLTHMRVGHSINAALNQPYKVSRESDYTIPIHGDDREIDAVLVEIRNDLIRDAAGIEKWTSLLTSVFHQRQTR